MGLSGIHDLTLLISFGLWMRPEAYTRCFVLSPKPRPNCGFGTNTRTLVQKPSLGL